jgi:cyanate lyase
MHMSAIDFDLELDRLANPKGDRVRLLMSGELLPLQVLRRGAGVPEDGFKEK